MDTVDIKALNERIQQESSFANRKSLQDTSIFLSRGV